MDVAVSVSDCVQNRIRRRCKQSNICLTVAEVGDLRACTLTAHLRSSVDERGQTRRGH